ncbi:hypothetical protein BT96DRAFT_922045, partial [Gymnopus androsaceus JB14]
FSPHNFSIQPNFAMNDPRSHGKREFDVAPADQVTAPLPSSQPPPSSAAAPSTPKRSTQPSQTSSHTPAVGKITSGSSYRAVTNTEAKRNAVISSLPAMIPEISLDEYFTHILPPLPESLEGKVDLIMQILKDSGVITAKGRWKSFLADPKNQKKETVVFKKLSNIFDAVIAAAKNLDGELEQTFELFVEPNTAPDHPRGGKSRPDGFVKQKARRDGEGEQKEEPPHAWFDIAHPQEFKLNESPSGVDDDASKVVYSMQQILALDPRRRFTTGSTIENRTTRLWFLSRSILFTTESFDFMTDHKRLVHLYLSLAFSSSTDSGWDPSVKFSHVDPLTHKRIYEITVTTKQGDEVVTEIYTTVSILSEVSADAMGRATRVWLVVDSNGKYRVLKDLWLDKDRAPEHEIRADILRDVHKTQDKATEEKLRSHMLTPIAHCKVCIEGVEDDTTAVMMRGYDLSDARMIPFRTPPVPAGPSTQSRGLALPSDRDSISQSIEFSTTAKFATTNDIASESRALVILHNAGWVHRDLSAGNVYWYAEGSRGLLGDFEYAKLRTNNTAHEIRTGTPYFMAAETLSHAYLFQPRPRTTSTHRQPLRYTPDYKPRKVDVSAPINKKPPPPPFAYNSLHDLESVWWILMYVLFFNEDKAHFSPQPEKCQGEMNCLFDGRMESTHSRNLFFQTKFAERFDTVSQFLSPTFVPALDVLRFLSNTLNEAYTSSERDYPKIDDSPGLAPHSEWLDALTSPELLEAMSKIELDHVKSRAEDLPTSGAGKKRKSDGDSELVDEPKSKKSKPASSSLPPPRRTPDHERTWILISRSVILSCGDR